LALDRETIGRRLAKLEGYLTLLHELEGVDEETFVAEPKIHFYAAYLLQLAIQCVLDIGAHMVSGLNLGQVDKYADIPALLARRGIVSEELAVELAKMFGLRNILVHEYLEVDFRALYSFIKSKLSDFKEFATNINRFLEGG